MEPILGLNEQTSPSMFGHDMSLDGFSSGLKARMKERLLHLVKVSYRRLIVGEGSENRDSSSAGSGGYDRKLPLGPLRSEAEVHRGDIREVPVIGGYL
jgi:hypothetical protein